MIIWQTRTPGALEEAASTSWQTPTCAGMKENTDQDGREPLCNPAIYLKTWRKQLGATKQSPNVWFAVTALCMSPRLTAPGWMYEPS